MAIDPSISVYKRDLPCPPAVSFTSSTGRELFSRSLSTGFLEAYFPLSEQFRTQHEPAYCGLTTLVMVLNTLQIDPGRPWKGIWRWFHEDMLDCCSTLADIKDNGVTFDQVACLARCNGALVTSIRASDFSIDEFRHIVKTMTSMTAIRSSSSELPHSIDEFLMRIPECQSFLITSYDRRVVSQTGIGHFSPISGYDPVTDMVLVLDVARYKYPPHWLPLPLLHQAMMTIDDVTGLTRGIMVLSKQEVGERISVVNLSDRWFKSMNLSRFDSITTSICQSLKTNDWARTIQQLETFFDLPSHIPRSIHDMTHSEEEHTGWSQSQVFLCHKILDQVQATKVFKEMLKHVASKDCVDEDEPSCRSDVSSVNEASCAKCTASEITLTRLRNRMTVPHISSLLLLGLLHYCHTNCSFQSCSNSLQSCDCSAQDKQDMLSIWMEVDELPQPLRREVELLADKFTLLCLKEKNCPCNNNIV